MHLEIIYEKTWKHMKELESIATILFKDLDIDILTGEG